MPPINVVGARIHHPNLLIDRCLYCDTTRSALAQTVPPCHALIFEYHDATFSGHTLRYSFFVRKLYARSNNWHVYRRFTLLFGKHSTSIKATSGEVTCAKQARSLYRDPASFLPACPFTAAQPENAAFVHERVWFMVGFAIARSFSSR